MAALGNIRRRSALLFAVIGIAMLAFIMTDFFNSMRSGGSSNIVGKIYGENITIQQYEAEIEKITTNWKNQNPNAVLNSAITAQLRNQAWEDYMRDIIMNSEYSKIGLDVSEEEWWELLQGSNAHPEIQNIPSFQDPSTGVFDRTKVVSYVQNIDQDNTGEAKSRWITFQNYLISLQKSEKYNKSEEVYAGNDGVFVSSPIDSLASSDFRVLSKEFETPWYALEIVNRPLMQGQISLDVTYPKYTGLKNNSLVPGEGPYELINGSILKISGETDKLLSKAFINSNDSQIDLSIDSYSFRGELSGNNLITGSYVINVEDIEIGVSNMDGEMSGLGFNESPKFRLRVVNDRKPKLNIKTNGLSGMIVPGAIIPYSGEIADDFAVNFVEIIYSIKEDTGERRELTGKLPPNGIQPQLGGKEILIDDYVDLAPLDLPVNSRFSLHFTATDNNNETGPNIGESTRMLFRVVGEAELRTDLLRREKEQRQLIIESIKKQDAILTDSGALAAELVDVDELSRDSKERLANLQKNQKNFGNDISNVARSLEGMVMEIKNNKLEKGDVVPQNHQTII